MFSELLDRTLITCEIVSGKSVAKLL